MGKRETLYPDSVEMPPFYPCFVLQCLLACRTRDILVLHRHHRECTYSVQCAAYSNQSLTEGKFKQTKANKMLSYCSVNRILHKGNWSKSTICSSHWGQKNTKEEKLHKYWAHSSRAVMEFCSLLINNPRQLPGFLKFLPLWWKTFSSITR